MENAGKLLLKLDLDQVRLSHVLKMKRLFRHFSGRTPLVIEFLRNRQPHAQIHIDPRWGVAPSPDLASQLGAIPSLLSQEMSHQ